MISRRLLHRMGWNLQQIPLYRIRQTGIYDITAFAEEITRRIKSDETQEEEARILQEHLMIRLGELLEPWTQDIGANNIRVLSPRKLYRLFDQAKH